VLYILFIIFPYFGNFGAKTGSCLAELSNWVGYKKNV